MKISQEILYGGIKEQFSNLWNTNFMKEKLKNLISYLTESTHSLSFIQTKQLTLYREVIDICSEIRTMRSLTNFGVEKKYYIF